MSIPNAESDDQPAKVMDFTSYENIELSMERFDARGYVFGIQTPRITSSQTATLFRDGVLQNYINVRIPGRNATARALFDRVEFLNFNRPGFTNYPGPLAVEMDYRDDDTASPSSVRAEFAAFNKVSSDNFRVYYLEDESAPCSTRRTGIHGFVCPTSVTPPPPTTPTTPAAPSNLAVK